MLISKCSNCTIFEGSTLKTGMDNSQNKKMGY